MTRAINRSNKSKFFRKLASFREDERGLAAVEFAYVLPLMLLMLLGAFEISRAISMDRKLNAVTAVTGDLVAREETADENSLDAIMNIINQIVAPYDIADLRLTVIPVMADNNDPPTPFVYADGYSFADKTTPPARCSAFDLGNASDVLTPGGSLIVVQAEYDYEPIFGDVIMALQSVIYGGNFGDPATYRSQSIHSPRQGCVDFEGNNCISNCPQAGGSP